MDEKTYEFNKRNGVYSGISDFARIYVWSASHHMTIGNSYRQAIFLNNSLRFNIRIYNIAFHRRENRVDANNNGEICALRD